MTTIEIILTILCIFSMVLGSVLLILVLWTLTKGVSFSPFDNKKFCDDKSPAPVIEDEELKIAKRKQAEQEQAWDELLNYNPYVAYGMKAPEE